MARYDEDLHENEFFRTLVSKHTAIFNEAAEKKLLVCVPRCDTVSRLKLSQSDFENHILRPSTANKYTSLNEKCAEIQEDVIITGPGYKEVRKVKILFEECFFNPNDESYQVLCLDQPLEGVTCDDVAMVSLETMDECCKFLGNVSGFEKARKSIDHSMNQFASNQPLLEIVEKMSEIYTQAVQEVWKLPSIRKVQSLSYRNSYKLAIETYIMANLHQQVFKELCFYLSPTDAALNTITRNYSDISPGYLGIKPQYRINIEKARVKLSELNQVSTPLEKLCCFRRSISVLTTMLGTSADVMTADDLLPILVYLVITSDIPNWNANIFYISKFHFSNVNQNEFLYCLTSFEAAVEYVRTEVTKNMSSSSPLSSLTWLSTSTESGGNAVSLFFKYIQRNNLDEVKELLDQEGMGSTADDFCHPLCSCEKCTSLVEKRLNDTNRVTVNTRDADGQTGLHHAAKYGVRNIVQYLMEKGASVTAADHHSSTPLHLACQKGHQSCLLLLLADSTESVLNTKDEAGNTPLHLACSNGHEECAKALLFQKKPCQIDATNMYGDTPLHNAARWGYASIVAVLLEHGASVNVINKSGEAPLNCAQSRKVQDLLARRDIPRGASVSAKPADSQKAQRRRSKVPDVGGIEVEMEKQLKKLLRAIRDNDLKLVEFMFTKSNVEDYTSLGKPPVDSHHPLCSCDSCFQNTLINAYDASGFAPLHHAAKQGNVKMVEFLLSHGADVGAITKGDSLVSLHLACQYNHRDIAVILLDNGSDVNACDCHGNTPLHFSCSNGHVDTAAILLYHGADVTKANDREDTALHHAARWNQCTLVKELLLYGAQYSATNKDHKTPLELTKDDQVRAVIEKAMRGDIEVGLYRTNTHIVQRTPEPTQDVVLIPESDKHSVNKNFENEVHNATEEGP